jgi:hypothetical protein
MLTDKGRAWGGCTEKSVCFAWRVRSFVWAGDLTLHRESPKAPT